VTRDTTTLLASDDASIDSPAALDPAAASALSSKAPEPLMVSLAAWETDGGRVAEPHAAAVPAGTPRG